MSLPKLDIYDLFSRGQRLIQDEQAALEVTKAGKLRVGNTGMVTPDGVIVGPCMSATYLRYNGIDIKGLDDDGDSGGAPGRELMFEGGRSNETDWHTVLKKTWYGPILREEEIATHWQTVTGISVTGRPDLVLCESITKSGRTTVEPKIGIELKLVCSFWTAYEVLIKNIPKHAHLMQAAHYSWQLGIPFELWYTSRVDYHVQKWVENHMPKKGDEKSYAITYDTKTGKPMKINPFIIGYKLELRDGVLHYTDAISVNKGRPVTWIKTDVTVDNIKRYYESIPQLTTVPPEPVLLKADGSKASYKASTYCSLGNLCCKYREGQDINEWKSEVSAKVSQQNSDK